MKSSKIAKEQTKRSDTNYSESSVYVYPLEGDFPASGSIGKKNSSDSKDLPDVEDGVITRVRFNPVTGMEKEISKSLRSSDSSSFENGANVEFSEITEAKDTVVIKIIKDRRARKEQIKEKIDDEIGKKFTQRERARDKSNTVIILSN